MKSTAWAPLGRALRDYQAGDRAAEITVHSDFGDAEQLPVAHFFRERGDLRPLEDEAVSRCRGRILDVGAGAGAITLLLQDQGFRTTAIDPLPEAVQVMKERGVMDARLGDLFHLPTDLRADAPFDTVLLLMNGAGLAGTLPGLGVLLGTVRSLLREGGLLLIDSTDLRTEEPKLRPGEDGEGGDRATAGADAAEEVDGAGEAASRADENARSGNRRTLDGAGVAGDIDSGYEGELHYQLEYGGERGDPFPYLFVDPQTLRTCAEACGWHFELLAQEEEGDFLAGLTC